MCYTVFDETGATGSWKAADFNMEKSSRWWDTILASVQFTVL